MCTILYLGTNQALRADSAPAREGGVAPATPKTRPAALSDFPHVYELVDWHQGRPGCSCLLNEETCPWDDADVDETTLAGWRDVRDVIAPLVASSATVSLFPVWIGDEAIPAGFLRQASPEHLAPRRWLFEDYGDGGLGAEARIRVDIVLGLDEPGPLKPVTP